ncbi:DUF4258 domain-containing protein [Trinickia sp. NRRL B-1857]|uniref:DUF4258 domain-containing protein n=1 Tax=Trinickia sp. NRRL B-1857 TaxID=3162879 RepID=UPI003D2E4C4E
MSVRTLALKLNDENLKRMIREAVADSARVFFTPHARKRMKQRKITPTQVYDCLRSGTICESAHVNIHGHWQCTLTRRQAGDEVTVAAAVERDENGHWIAVITVY